MAIARGRVSIDSSYNYKVNINGGSPSQTPEESSSSLGFHGIMNHAYQKSSIGDEYVDSMVNYGPSNNNIVNLPTISDPSSSSSGTGGFAFGIENSSSDSHQSFLNFKSTAAAAAATDCNYSHSYLSSSMLRFDQGNHDRFEDYLVFPDGLVDSNNGQQNNQINLKYCEDSTVAIDSRNCLEISSRNGLMAKDCWVYSDKNIGSDHDQDHELQERGLLDGEARKRPHMGGELVLKASKKHCSGTQSKKVKHKTNSSIKDPQSLAAKNRRERISEKLNILQDLIPNGSKVDLVTMLEKAISYVKFLQLQVKVLAADEFWPTQDGKAPEVSQVKAAIDAILLSSPRVAT